MKAPVAYQALPLYKLATVLYWTAAALLLYGGAVWVLHRPLFALKKVEIVRPLAYTSAGEVRSVVDGSVAGNFFTIDLPAVQRALEQLPWIAEARVSRLWPDTLRVVLVERTPYARWQGGGLVSDNGTVFAGDVPGDFPLFAGPTGSGQEMLDSYRAFQNIVAPLGVRITELDLSARQAWRMTWSDGTELALGRVDVPARLARFVALYGPLVARLNAKPVYVDLRYADGFAVRLPARTGAARAASGRNKQ